MTLLIKLDQFDYWNIDSPEPRIFTSNTPSKELESIWLRRVRVVLGIIYKLNYGIMKVFVYVQYSYASACAHSIFSIIKSTFLYDIVCTFFDYSISIQ